MTDSFGKLTVATLQVLALCTEELTRKLESGGKAEGIFRMGDYGYPLARVMSVFLEYLDSIVDEDAITLVTELPENSEFIEILGTGQITILSKSDLLSVLERKLIGRLSIIAPMPSLHWALLTYFEDEIIGGPVSFKFVSGKLGKFDRAAGLGNLLKLVEHGWQGEHIVEYPEL